MEHFYSHIHQWIHWIYIKVVLPNRYLYLDWVHFHFSTLHLWIECLCWYPLDLNTSFLLESLLLLSLDCSSNSPLLKWRKYLEKKMNYNSQLIRLASIYSSRSRILNRSSLISLFNIYYNQSFLIVFSFIIDSPILLYSLYICSHRFILILTLFKVNSPLIKIHLNLNINQLYPLVFIIFYINYNFTFQLLMD